MVFWSGRADISSIRFDFLKERFAAIAGNCQYFIPNSAPLMNVIILDTKVNT